MQEHPCDIAKSLTTDVDPEFMLTLGTAGHDSCPTKPVSPHTTTTTSAHTPRSCPCAPRAQCHEDAVLFTTAARSLCTALTCLAPLPWMQSRVRSPVATLPSPRRPSAIWPPKFSASTTAATGVASCEPRVRPPRSQGSQHSGQHCAAHDHCYNNVPGARACADKLPRAARACSRRSQSESLQGDEQGDG